MSPDGQSPHGVKILHYGLRGSIGIPNSFSLRQQMVDHKAGES